MDDLAPQPRVKLWPGQFWPANVLRFHLQFDRPMTCENALRNLALTDRSGSKIEAPFVDIRDGLWNADQTLLTVLFHPGRIKSGVGKPKRRYKR